MVRTLTYCYRLDRQHASGLWSFGAILALFVGSSLGASAGASAADWPQWRGDANRSGATEHSGPQSPELAWSRTLPHPDPAYDHQYRMCADISYTPIAAQGLLFLPSNVTDEVMALELDSGMVRWRYNAEGPVRFAPVYLDGRVVFGSDDGFLVCVSAESGELLWKVRGAPERFPDSRLLVNGRLCSRWPVRGAPVAHDGVVFFGAGIWPEEGVYVCAVGADTGEVLWRNDSLSYVKDGMSDHGRSYDLSLPPQGYLAHIDGKLAVPSGRSLAAWFDSSTGEMEPYTCFYVKHNPPRGTWYITGIGRYAVQGGNWFGTRSDATPPLPPDLKGAKSALFWSKQLPENEVHVMKHRPFLRADTYLLHPENLYTEPVLTPATMFASEFVKEQKYLVERGHTRVKFPEYDRIVARDLRDPHWGSVEHMHVAYGKKKVTMPKLEFPILWELASPLRVLIKAGDQLYAGGENLIASVAIPPEGEKPRISWQAEISGTPVEALVADEKLVVVTQDGHVYCFGDGGSRNSADPIEMDSKQPATKHLHRDGYALVFGAAATSVKELSTKDRLRVVVIEPDPIKAAAIKADLARQSLCGSLVQVIQSDLTQMMLTPYWANRVVIESLERFDSPKRALSMALDSLRPMTGTLQMPGSSPHASQLRELISVRSGYTLKTSAQELRVCREGSLEGSDDWTHEAGGPGNCFANADDLVKWPLGVLWYSGAIDRYFTPASHFQHERHPFPLVRDGRMFIITGADLHAVDIYTGDYLWKAEMPKTPWVETRSFDSRMYGRPTERNCLVADDWVYLVVGETVHAYDVVSGKQQKVLGIPASLREQSDRSRQAPQTRQYHGHRATIQGAPQWTEVRLWDDLLISLLGNTLVAVDRHTGDLRWSRPSSRQITTCAISDTTLFGIDCDEPELGGGSAGEARSALLFAMDPRTAKIRWKEPMPMEPVPEYTLKSERIWLRPIVPLLSYNQKHDLVVVTLNRSGIEVFQGRDGSPVWSKPRSPVGDLHRTYPPLVTDDHLLISNYKGFFGYLLDIRTGEEVGDNTGIPQPRTCARVIGNKHLLVYRDAATEFYDVPNNRTIGLNSLRSGCTTSFIPAGGVMTAPMLGHGCVCNYPMFSSLGLYHLPETEQWRPAAVAESWTNEAEELMSNGTMVVESLAGNGTGEPIDLRGLQLINSQVQVAGASLLFGTKDLSPGYAIRETREPLTKASFTLSAKRAVGSSGKARHGNVFFVCAPSNAPQDFIECRCYYGGRSSIMITGRHVKPTESKIDVNARQTLEMKITVDCQQRTVSFEAAGAKIITDITIPIDGITHFGYGGANSDNLVSDIDVR